MFVQNANVSEKCLVIMYISFNFGSYDNILGLVIEMGAILLKMFIVAVFWLERHESVFQVQPTVQVS